MAKNNPRVSVIIPSLDGYRDGNVPKLIEQIHNQTFKDLEVDVVKGIRPNGQARNVGAKRAKGEILIFIDDDVRLGHERVLENLVKPFSDDQSIGIAGASQLIPEDSSWFQRRAAKGPPRAQFPVVEKLTESDMVNHTCLAIPTQLYKDVGWENEDLISGSDPDLRYRVRKIGYKIAVVPNTWVYHPMPESLLKLLKVSFRKGRNSAWVYKYYPHLIYELDRGYKRDFIHRRSLVYRIFRFLAQVVWSILTLRWIFLLARMAYAFGFLGNLIWREKE